MLSPREGKTYRQRKKNKRKKLHSEIIREFVGFVLLWKAETAASVASIVKLFHNNLFPTTVEWRK